MMSRLTGQLKSLLQLTNTVPSEREEVTGASLTVCIQQMNFRRIYSVIEGRR